MAPPRRGLDQGTWNFQPPKNEGKDNAAARQDWLQNVVSVGEQFNASLTSSRDLPNGISMIAGRNADKPNQQRSNLKIPREKRALREIIANIADIRTIDAYSSENPAYQPFLAMLNKVWKSVYFESKFPTKFKKAVQWMTVGGYSYMSPVYRNLYPSNRSARRIDFDVYSSQDCLPFQLPDDNSVQGAFAWTRIVFKPLYQGMSMFPKFQGRLKPIARRRYSGNISKDRIALAERFRNDMRTATGQSQGGNWTEQMMEFRYTSVRDLSINEGKEPKPMGEPGALESYVVPYVGQMIPTGNFTLSHDTGKPVREMRKAEEDDCYLYPNLRLFISQTGMSEPIYDGPAFDWHGMHPLVRVSADEWPWEPGYSLSEDIASLGQSREKFMRGLEQTASARFDPAILYDKNAGLNRKTMEQFDPYEERGRLGVDGSIGETVIRTALPEELLSQPEWALAWEEKLEKEEDYILGNDAMNNLAKAKVAGADDALLKAMEEAGPIVKDISSGCNEPVQDMMMMCLSDVLQYYPPGRLMQYVGAEGMARESFSLDINSAIPAHGPEENPDNGKSIYTRMQLTQNFCAAIHCTIAPGELHGVVQTGRKLLLIQMQRSGSMIDSETVMKAADVANWGTLPGNTVLEKWRSEQEMKLEFAVKMKELETALVGQGPSAPPSPIGVGGSKGAEGRPPSGNKPAHMETKASASGPRMTITES
jgi:hypothetical protein